MYILYNVCSYVKSSSALLSFCGFCPQQQNALGLLPEGAGCAGEIPGQVLDHISSHS